ncbi:isochorismate synthase [Sphingomonas flavalba]|uniref:isochorismate synthase n=1 Tax=Sphingomonas flavalba TaxID=2559804 RepID=UPI0039E0BAFA
MFVIGFDGGLFVTSGGGAGLRCQGIDRLGERLATYFSGSDVPAGQILVGAIPFDRSEETVLVAPQRVCRVGRSEGAAILGQMRRAGAPAQPVHVTETPPAPVYADMVNAALARIDGAGAAGLSKVVLSRALRIEMDGPADPVAIAQRLLNDTSVTVFLATLQDDKAIVGATPELLLSRRGLDIVSHPLAGSMPRSPDPVADRAAADALLRSDKDRREHELVVEAVFDTLAPYCAELSARQGTGLRSTATVWHLGTRIEGRLKSEDAPSAAVLAALLHPTPAVGGYPRQDALATIRELETYSRGYYAGAVGWVDEKGDGEWHVSLRCAQIDGRTVTLHAGAGIVAGSDPAAELAETAAKFRAMLGALGLDDGGRLFEDAA